MTNEIQQVIIVIENDGHLRCNGMLIQFKKLIQLIDVFSKMVLLDEGKLIVE